MNSGFVTKVCCAAALGTCMGGHLYALEVDATGNAVFDLYFFGNGEYGVFGTLTGDDLLDQAKKTGGIVANSSAHYWNAERKQAMLMP